MNILGKRAVDIRIDEKNPQMPVQMTKEEAKALVEEYAKRSPEKYEIKKDALQKWIDSFN